MTIDNATEPALGDAVALPRVDAASPLRSFATAGQPGEVDWRARAEQAERGCDPRERAGIEADLARELRDAGVRDA